MELNFMSAPFLLALIASLFASRALAAEICNEHCDGADSSIIDGASRVAVEARVNTRVITLLIADENNMAYARISNAAPGDEVWIDRSFDAGLSWDDGSLLGFKTVPQGQVQTDTLLYNVDDPKNKGLGAVRACGRGLVPSDLVCTEWARSTVMAETDLDAAATALMQFYNGALFHTVGWWNAANAFTALVQYMVITGKVHHLHVVESTFTKNLEEWDGNFTSDALDDVAWWTLAWVDAYDLTGNMTYLEMAIYDADYMYQYVDDVCGGGIWWNIYRNYKNAITNELYIYTAAALHNRIPGDTKYLNQATTMWTWFKGSGMINEDNLINDGLRDDCSNNRQNTWTYNQGVILGGLVELYKATNDQTYLDEARKIADAVTSSDQLSPGGILTEPCEGGGPTECGVFYGGCDCNAITFKGVFMRHLGFLNRNLLSQPYDEYIARQVTSNLEKNRNALNQYGVHYAGPLIDVNAGTTQSGLEALTAFY